jgi:hypothetical protein
LPASGKGQGWGYGGWYEVIKVVFGYNSMVFVGYMPKTQQKMSILSQNPLSIVGFKRALFYSAPPD